MFKKIDMETWSRRSHYEYYSNKIKTSYQVTVRLNVSKLLKQCEKKKLRFYPCMNYAIMKAVNTPHNKAFRMALDEEGNLGYYDICHPSYTIFHDDDHTFSDIWTEYNEDFEQFYLKSLYDMAIYQEKRGVKVKPDQPKNFVSISCTPWLNFESVSFDTDGPAPMYFPIIVFGRYDNREKREKNCTMPFSIYVNHAAADAYHTSRLIHDIQENIDNCKEWMTDVLE